MEGITERNFMGERLFVVTWEGATQDLFLGEAERDEAMSYAERLKANGGPLFYDEEEE
jgi:hypothetical protein